MVRRVPRSRARRVADSAFGLLLLVKALVVGALVVAVLAAGVWRSGGPVHAALGVGRGVLTVRACGTAWCTGPVAGVPGAPGVVRVDRLVVAGPGERVGVAVRPGAATVVRSGRVGALFGLRSLAGALLLAALGLGFGLGARRTAWGAAVLGVVLVAVPFALR